MGWTYFIILVIGVAIGAVGNWFWQQAQQRKLSHLTANQQKAAIAPPEVPATTSLHTLEDQLQRTELAYHMAVEMEKFKSGFLARSSHELRSPINSVISLHQLILSDLCENPAEEREFIAQAQQAAEKMLSLLDRLIGLSKTVYGSEQLQIQPLNLKEVLAEVQHFTQLQAQNRNIRLEFEPPDPDLQVLADPRWLRQVLLGLVDMPISLMQEGYVRLKTQVDSEGQQISIWVEDQRPAEFWSEPIDLLQALKAKLPALVEAAETTPPSPKLPSSGLNLLIVQTLLDLMGGRLEVLEIPAPLNPAEEAQVQPLTRIRCSLPLTTAAD